MQPLREVGFKVPDRVLQAAELHDLEPALAGSVSAGILLEEHWHVHAPPFMRALASRLADLGVRLEEGAEVSEVVSADGRVSEVRSTAGGFPADAVVLAAGAWSARLARDLGFAPPPVRPGKGYSFEVDMQTLPRHALLLLEPHVGCSPLGDRLRIAGTMEFSGVNARVDERRIEAIVRGAAGMLRGIDSPKVNDLRSGMRPIAPDGLPIIDRVPGYANAYIATAYSMLGMTLAAPAAEALAEFVLTGRRPPQLEPFAATRFRSPIALARRHAGRSAARQYARRRIGRSS
jgi:D-amino-acid dehydrogenase